MTKTRCHVAVWYLSLELKGEVLTGGINAICLTGWVVFKVYQG